ncbi:afadin [Cottoperca gobio]|uniref:Afadin n=1 Tax=Cottoperca gobio TaxID=56716 RepID=A0A6J2PFT3_COTGO|nr:afadin-like [Cottoperca gobio]
MPEEENREELAKVIRQWNNNRLDLFEISGPDESSLFHGVMRFYFEDRVGGNVATKCLRVCSDSAAHEVIETLSEKFRPDMKMLSTSYSLFEIHGNKERKLDLQESPLLVQLKWNTDSREGRFVLKKDSLEERGGVMQSFRRTLSRKEKKKEKNTAKEEKGSTEKLVNSSSTCVSDHETNPRTQPAGPGGNTQPGLPLAVTFSASSEEAFLSAVINYTNSSTVHFKLSPAFVLYAAGRFALQRHARTGPPHAHGVTVIADKMVAMTGKVIQRQQTLAGALAFWMANSSELMNFFKLDKDLDQLTRQSQLDLSRLVHRAHSFLLQCLQSDLRKHLPTFLIDPEQHGALPAGIELVLNTLMNTMSLLRRCRVNPALTIQLFSQLFHFISAWLFNQLMSPDAGAPGLRSHYWGAALRQRLTAIEGWAERQGLELAADCHLGHIIQATTLLTMNKYSMQDVKAVQNTCFKLNSLQLQTLLSGYLYATNEPHIPPDLMDAVVTAAEASADNLIRSEGRDVQLQESLDLQLPFLLPEGGYSCDTMTGIPPGFREFLEPICQKGLCSLTPQPSSEGKWSVCFREASCAESTYLAVHREPEPETITLNKPLNSGMGISIVAAKGAGRGNLGIYIKSIVKGGPAEMNGRLTAGDQLLRVDAHSLLGLSQERAAAIMMHTGPVVTLQVAKCGASFHGLGALLREPGRSAEGDTGPVQPSVEAPAEPLHGGSRRKREQLMQKNRRLYRSNPNVTDFPPDEVEPVMRGNNMAAVSSVDLCTAETFHREYLTLPTPRPSQDQNISESSRPLQTCDVSLTPPDGQRCSKRTFMRQALSQENLCVDSGRPLLDRRQTEQRAKQTLSLYSSFPLRLSVSTHDMLSDSSSPAAQQQQGGRTSGAGVWRNPFPQHPTPTPCSQPIRIDIPVPRAVSTNPPLTTFQSSALVAARRSQTLRVDKNRVHHVYACPVKLPPPSQLQQRPTARAAKPQVSIMPTKHVSFQDPPAQQTQCDPWRRDAQEKLEKQQRLHVVQLLQQELQDLQGKARRTPEESGRLRRLSLEWQFQKRLQEVQQRGEGEEDEEDEEDEDLHMMLTIQQLENRAQRSCAENINTELKESEEQTGSHRSQNEDKTKTDQRPERTESRL